MKKEIHLIKKIQTDVQKLFQRNVRSLHRLHERSRIKFQRGARRRSVITFARRKRPARHAQSSAQLVPVDLFTLLFWGIVILAFFLRFYDLASKPLHHDEGLYGVYCWRFFKGETYKYDPMMHGPFMFHFQLLVFFLFGVGDFSVKIAPALLGSLMIASTYYLKDYLGKIGVLITALFFTFSPTHLYFSRFLRHDIYIVFFTYTAVVFGLLYYRTLHKKYLYLTAASLSLMFCVKENAYIHTFIFVTFLCLKEFCRSCLFPITNDSEKFRDRFKSYWATQSYALLFAAFIFAWIYILLYSTFFTNPGGFLDGLYRKSLTYWWNQHSIQRIKGPFHYYVRFILLYELPVFLIVGGGTLFCIGKILHNIANTLNKKIVIVWATIFSACLILYFGHQALPPWLGFIWMKTVADLILSIYILGLILWAAFHFINRKDTITFGAFFTYWAAVGLLVFTVFSVYLIRQFGHHPLPLWFAFTHMEILADLVLTLCVLCVGLWATLYFIKQRETLTAFFTYWSAIGFLIYSYAGEKVPWLFLHILVPVVLLAGKLLNQFFTSEFWRKSFKVVRIAVVVVGLLFGMYVLHSTILLNYYHSANPVETMVYTQTSTDILKMLEVIRDVKFSLGSEEAKKPIVAVQGNAVWPLAWYLRDYEGWFQPGDLPETRRPFIVVNWEDRKKYREILEDEYQEIRVKLREWWIPQPGGTLSDWWKYLLYREVFNPTGSSDVAFYIRRWEPVGSKQ